MDDKFIKEINNRFLDSLADTVGFRYYINIDTEPDTLGTKLLTDLGYLPNGSYSGDVNKSKCFIDEYNSEFAKIWSDYLSDNETDINPYEDYEKIELIAMEKIYNVNFEKVMNKLNLVAKQNNINLDNLDRNSLLVDEGLVNFSSYALGGNYNENLFKTYLEDLSNRTNISTNVQRF